MKTFKVGQWVRIVAGPPDVLVGEVVMVVPLAGSQDPDDEVCAATEDGELLALREHQLERVSS